MKQLALLHGDVKHYNWGGTHYIPSLLQIENPNAEPYAEYWMGAHPQAKSFVELDDDKKILLKDYIQQNPEKTLGASTYKRFDHLPYLLKVLDVKDMLSIQVHPTKALAAIDFEEENKKGVALNAPDRNYKDANHKPELMVAMSEFYLLHGFKPEESLLKVLDAVPELKLFIPVFKKEGYAGMYKMAMELPQEEVNEILQPLLDRIIPQYQQNTLAKTNEDFWAARAALTFAQPGTIDRGIFSIYFFNLLQLQQGEAIFQDAGLPHAYLEGYNVEIMASSDNVLRGGLTAKHIDTVELLKHTKCEATIPNILSGGRRNGFKKYIAPVKDFELVSYRLKKGERLTLRADSVAILLLMDGAIVLQHKTEQVQLQQGAIAAVAMSGTVMEAEALEDCLLFKAGVPL